MESYPNQTWDTAPDTRYPLPPVLAEVVEAPPTRPRRNVIVPGVLFAATCVSTFLAGMQGFSFQESMISLALSQPLVFLGELAQRWQAGLTYMLAVMAILLAHEMGHFLQAVRYRVPASLPFFIPMPFTPLGTMGAVIGMEKSTADRRQLFDIGLSGPLAGLVVAIPVTCWGILRAQIVEVPPPGTLSFGDPLIFKLLVPLLRPGATFDTELYLNPLLMAGWVGMLITGLNMFPISQLDGGHVIYALFGRYSWLMVRAVLVGCIAAIVYWQLYVWTVMFVLVVLIGIDHPRTANDRAPLGWWRWTLGLASLAIPVLCFVPNPFPGL